MRPHGDGWRSAWKDDKGGWKQVTRKVKSELLELAHEKARKVHNGSASTDFTPDQIALLKRVLKLGITHAELDGRKAMRKAVITSPTLGETIAAMIKAKSGAAGGRRRSRHAGEPPLHAAPRQEDRRGGASRH
ncbi:hypothetical protein [Verrucomicrobium spinosum]|uniref:hypothetical protein n=1 Tax=Verrucomicrobium spinosum TaxID=2736 RepID=UPI0001744EAA|nr:hypothetical protein [Verrucomicrobium spinosum]